MPIEANAEYLVLNGEGKPCTFEEYQSTALKITDQRFPRFQEPDPETLVRLQHNEAKELKHNLKNAGITPVKIPKTLYDLFYWHFYLQDMAHSEVREADIENAK